MKPNRLFENVYVVNLNRRPERMTRFERDWTNAFADSEVYGGVAPYFERFEAYDGDAMGAPDCWTAGDGAYGCCWSHLALWARILSRGVGPDDAFVIFEDDAIFVEGFVDKAEEVFRNVPDFYDLFYLGGQHLTHKKIYPYDVAPGVQRAYNVNRNHATVVSGRGVKKLVDELAPRVFNQPQRKVDGPANHIDHELGRLTERRQIICYAAKPWLVGQGGGESDICGKNLEARFWQ